MDKNNFISKIRVLTKEHENLPFEQKYPILALEIEQSARKGNNCYIIPYTSLPISEKQDLEAEGFKVEQYNVLEYKISW
jgi:hypothetical protein